MYPIKYIQSLIKITSTKSPSIIAATLDYMCCGFSISEAAKAYNTQTSNISRLKTRILKIDKTVRELRNIDPTGTLSPEYIHKLIELTKVPKTKTLEATIEHICKGKKSTLVAKKFHVKTSAILRLKGTIYKTNSTIFPLFAVVPET